jgi:hypothetical protein
MKVIIESDVEDRVPKGIITLLTEAAKLCNVDIWVTIPKEEIESEDGYGWQV